MQDDSGRQSNAARTADMRARLIAAARALFVDKGYAETSTPEIVKAAGVTRGALYHHFADKTDVFRAVCAAEAEAISNAVGEADSLEAGSLAYFQAMAAPGRVRLMLIDAPAVLGPAELDAMDAGGGRAALREGLTEALPGASAPDVAALATILSAGFDRAALEIGSGADQVTYLAAFRRLWGGLTR